MICIASIIRSVVGFVFLALLLLKSVVASPIEDTKYPSSSAHSVSLIDVLYDPATDTTKFTYQLGEHTWKNNPGNWVLSLNTQNIELISAAPSHLISYGLENGSKTLGIKWDASLDGCTPGIYSITVAGLVSVAEIEYAYQDNIATATGKTKGPGITVASRNTDTKRAKDPTLIALLSAPTSVHDNKIVNDLNGEINVLAAIKGDHIDL
ncbi:MAG: hypothetical protein OEZ43_18410 [Gammaproteobacteria bacterium]|nr:hypothetical protein [Gammaproteobacteria bacterium]